MDAKFAELSEMRIIGIIFIIFFSCFLLVCLHCSGWNTLKTYKLRRSAIDALVTYSDENHWWKKNENVIYTSWRIIHAENTTYGYNVAKEKGVPLDEYLLIKNSK